MRDSIYQHIGSIIKQRRKQLGMKQETLANELAISRGSLANIETGRQGILVHQLYKIALALKITPNDLLPAPDEPLPLDDWAEKLPPGLKPRQQQQIARLLEGAQAESTTERKEHNARPSKH